MSRTPGEDVTNHSNPEQTSFNPELVVIWCDIR